MSKVIHDVNRGTGESLPHCADCGSGTYKITDIVAANDQDLHVLNGKGLYDAQYLFSPFVIGVVPCILLCGTGNP